MNLKKSILVVSLSSVLSLPMLGSSLVNDMQGCQGLLDFIDGKLSSAPKKYSSSDVKTVRVGLKEYNDYIQQNIVTPGLIKFNAGDKTKANRMQKQVDEYKLTLVNAYNARYPQNRLFMDHSIDVNNCAKKAVPSGQALENLKSALNTMVKLSKLN